jgi:hypothetical protein
MRIPVNFCGWIKHELTIFGPTCPWDRDGNKKRKRAIERVDEEGDTTKFDSIAEAARSSNVSASNIGNVIGKRSKTAGGHQWRHAEQELE